jgi:hypothetical protein
VSETAFTPGPWRVDDGTYGVAAVNVPEDGGDIICSGPDAPASETRWQANAALIAAAPALYEALEHILNGALSLPRFAEDAAHKALALARGEPA